MLFAVSNLENSCAAALKLQYTQYNHIENYWKKFDVHSTFDADASFNDNIIVECENDKLKSIEGMFSKFQNDNKRLIIIAGAGMGKSTLVHELARQWVKGENAWTHKFKLLFLFRFSDIDKNETLSLQILLMKYLNSNDASELLDDFNMLKKCLFIFDGYDELQYQFHEVMETIIFGKQLQKSHIMITSRPCQKITQLECNWQNATRIELSGYTDEGLDKQLNKFLINEADIDDDDRKILTIPMFHSLYCIMYKSRMYQHVKPNRLCAAVVKLIDYAFKRYHNINRKFTEIEENEILLILGQVELSKLSLAKHQTVVRQNVVQQLANVSNDIRTSFNWQKFEEYSAAVTRFCRLSLLTKMSYMKNNNVEYPKIEQKTLSVAINAGLIYKKSEPTDIIFTNQIIADYCAAYFWFKTNPLDVKSIDDSMIMFVEPPDCSLHMGSLISCFLSYLCRYYKLSLWQTFDRIVPYLDEYVTLPQRSLNVPSIHIGYVPSADQSTVFDKIDFSFPANENSPILYLQHVRFVTNMIFKKLVMIDNLSLSDCTFKISPEEFFYVYDNIQRLELIKCKSNDVALGGTDFDKDCCSNNDLILESLSIDCCDFSMVNIISYIMEKCSSLKTFKLRNSFENKFISESKLDVQREDDCEDISNDVEGSDGDYYGRGWLTKLQKNETLLSRIEYFELVCSGTDDLTILFETLSKFINLKGMKLKVMDGLVKPRPLKKSEIVALEMSFENGLQNLKYIDTSLKDQHGEEIDLKMHMHLSEKKVHD